MGIETEGSCAFETETCSHKFLAHPVNSAVCGLAKLCSLPRRLASPCCVSKQCWCAAAPPARCVFARGLDLHHAPHARLPSPHELAQPLLQPTSALGALWHWEASRKEGETLPNLNAFKPKGCNHTTARSRRSLPPSLSAFSLCAGGRKRSCTAGCECWQGASPPLRPTGASSCSQTPNNTPPACSPATQRQRAIPHRCLAMLLHVMCKLGRHWS